MEQLPILIHGQECGVVRFRREGAYMVCRGQAKYDGDVVRLWMYGKGEPGYLGVLIPDGQGGAALHKKFSLADFSRLPNPMEYCATEGAVCPSTVQLVSETDVIWYPAGDGTLVRSDGRQLAFPTQNIHLPRGACFLLRTIEGREYVIFPC